MDLKYWRKFQGILLHERKTAVITKFCIKEWKEVCQTQKMEDLWMSFIFFFKVLYIVSDCQTASSIQPLFFRY